VPGLVDRYVPYLCKNEKTLPNREKQFASSGNSHDAGFKIPEFGAAARFIDSLLALFSIS
jgi:hypothetical protein